eukprot:g9928.t1
MGREIERKFLVSGDAWRQEVTSSSQFVQAYIAAGEDRSVRIRISDGSTARLTIKIGASLLSRDEYEYDIPAADAQELAKAAIGTVLLKTRHRVDYKGYTWEIDVYEGAYAGLVVAEVEMANETDEPPMPGWLGQEVTGDRRYSNMVMATSDLAKEAQLAKAIAYLEEQPDGPHEAIHDARKRFKRLRALYRLVQKDAPQFRRRENARIRDVARSLSTVRDATALVETTDYLLGFAANVEETAALEAARTALIDRRDRIAAEEHDLPAKMAAAVAACREAIGALEALQLSDDPRKVARRLGKAWEKQQRRAQAALAACRQDAGAETYHELRKSGQVYWMHLSLLHGIWPSAMRAKQAECKALVDLLGHEHDLSVLTEIVNESPELFGDSGSLARLIGAIINRQQALRQEAVAAAELALCDENGIKGTLLIAREGINGTVAGTDAAIARLLAYLRAQPEFATLEHKESRAFKMPFLRMKVRPKKEIVTMGVEDIDPNRIVGTYVEPKDWNALISDPETIVIDTRNDYETAIGLFKGAVDPKTKTFREFPDWVRNNSGLHNKPKIAMYCTGGIRCEKATAFMKEQGFDEVYHLKGGILKYLEEVPQEERGLFSPL